MRKVILASQSPRRLEILRKHGIEPIVKPSDTDEHLPDGIGMEDAVKLLALQKAMAAYNAIRSETKAEDTDISESAADGCVIVGADTIVYKEGILGKPKDDEDAFRMLSRIRNTSHCVCTGVALIDLATGEQNVLCDVTAVYCKDYSDEDIRKYIASGEPADKAGAYAIQGRFGRYIDHIEGDYENVVGLPYYRIAEYL